jgi:hypothetical protein
MGILTENVEAIFARDLELFHRFYTPASTPSGKGFAGPFFSTIAWGEGTVTVHTVNGGERELKDDTLVLVALPSFPA